MTCNIGSSTASFLDAIARGSSRSKMIQGFFEVIFKIKLGNAIKRRDKHDEKSNLKLLQVVNSVKGDPDEGEDGDLYATMGYVRWQRCK